MALRTMVRFISPAFTLIEMLCVIAIIAVLASLLLPSISKAKGEAWSISCRSNLKQLQVGWLLYVEDNEDGIPPNISRRVGFDQINMVADGRVPWVLGNAQIDTNTANIRGGVLYRYVGSADVYRCPADQGKVRDQPSIPQTRSYSTHHFLNCDVISGTVLDEVNTSRLNLRKYARIVDPPPSQAWVFVEEHESTIDDGIFVIHSPWFAPAAPDFWLSVPADRHKNSANLSFADGHVESHHWRFHRNVSQYSSAGAGPINSNDLADMKWIEWGLPHSP